MWRDGSVSIWAMSKQPLKVDRPRGSGPGPATDKPFDRIDVELLRLVLANNGGLPDLTPADFLDRRLGEAFAVLAPRIDSTPQGSPLDISDVEPLLQGMLLSLALDDRPLASIEEMTGRVRERRLDAEIAGLQAEMDLLTPGSEAHAEVLQKMMRTATGEAGLARVTMGGVFQGGGETILLTDPREPGSFTVGRSGPHRSSERRAEHSRWCPGQKGQTSRVPHDGRDPAGAGGRRSVGRGFRGGR